MILWRLSGARVRYGATVVTLPDVEVTRGERVAVIGRNGSGKSTLLRALAGLVDAEGRIDRGVGHLEVAWLSQRPYLLRDTVFGNVELALLPFDLPWDERKHRVNEMMARVGIADLSMRPRHALSEGQLQRVAIARALVTQPKALLLDEPLGPLDSDGARRLSEILPELSETTVVSAAPTQTGLPGIAFSRTIEMI